MRTGEVKPHDYMLPDIDFQSTRTRIGIGCYRTRPTSDSSFAQLSNWDVIMRAEQEVMRYNKN